MRRKLGIIFLALNVEKYQRNCEEVNSVDQKPERRAGEITVVVKLAGLDEQLAKAHELVETIEKARSLADDLAKGVNSIKLEL